MSAVDVAAESDVPADAALRVEVEGTPIALVRVGGTVRAVHDVCSHALASLSEGWVEGDRIECPRHGAAFSLIDGSALTLPATAGLPTFAVEVRDGRVLVDPTPSHPHPIA